MIVKELKIFLADSLFSLIFQQRVQDNAIIGPTEGPLGQIWGKRLRCRFIVSTGAIPGFPEGYKHILMSRGGASNGMYN